MPNLIKAALIAGFVSASLFAFTQSTTIKTVPVKPTSPVSGQQMYTSYCAACHGADGTGNGPAAPAMKMPPTDLTMLNRKNGGSFPSEHVQTVLRFGAETPAHGSADMPVWGDLLRTLHGSSASPNMEVNQRIINLTNYLKQMQK